MKKATAFRLLTVISFGLAIAIQGCSTTEERGHGDRWERDRNRNIERQMERDKLSERVKEPSSSTRTSPSSPAPTRQTPSVRSKEAHVRPPSKTVAPAPKKMEESPSRTSQPPSNQVAEPVPKKSTKTEEAKPQKKPTRVTRPTLEYFYLYYPNSFVYFDDAKKIYFYQEEGIWKSAEILPETIVIDQAEAVTINVDTDKPYLEFNKHKSKHPPKKIKKTKEKREKKEPEKESVEKPTKQVQNKKTEEKTQ